MNFISSEFVILLLITVTLCSLCRGKAVPLILLCASLVFYGWWNPAYLTLLGAVIAISWAGGLVIERYPQRTVLWAVVLGELALLVYFKYISFIVANIRGVIHAMGYPSELALAPVLLPAGISFMTFQGIAYAIDVYRGEIRAERSLINVALFKSFFPQLVAGPIERAAHLMPQLKRTEWNLLNQADFARGGGMILKGMIFKFVIADNMSVVVDAVYSNVAVATPIDTVFAVVAFAIQIYGDFYGYTLIALGSAWLFGVELVRNFEHPYLSTNIQEFWRRWHISLSQWFRDYLYIPLGGSRRGPVRHVINLLIVMLAVGLWHGASWTFVLWGFVHAVLLAGHAVYRKLLPEGKESRGFGLGAFAGWALTLFLVTLAWIPFRSPDLHTQQAVFRNLLAFVLDPRATTSAIYAYQFYLWIAGLFVLLEVVDASVDLEQRFSHLPAPMQLATFTACLTLTYLGPAKDVAFLYFQF